MSTHNAFLPAQPQHPSLITQLERGARVARGVVFRLLGLAMLLLLVVATVSSITSESSDRTNAANQANTSSQQAIKHDKEQTMTPVNPQNGADSNSPHSISSHVTTTTINGQTHTNVTVNGQPVAVPDNSDVHQTVTDNGVTTEVHVSSNNDNAGQSTSSSVSSTTIMTQQSQNST